MMRIASLLIAVALPGVLLAAEPVFEVRAWDLERFEPAYVTEMIGRAQDAGMNTISLSHEIVMNAEEILHDWHRYKHLKQFCSEAHRRNMEVYLWNHQINNPPEQLITRDEAGIRWLDFDNDLLRDWLYNRYQRVSDRVPNCDGIILSLTESEWQIQRDASEPAWLNICRNRARSRLSPAERMARVINTMRDSLHARGKRLIVRDFLRSPAEMEAFADALGDVPDDVWVLTKCVPNDWQFRYPPHPLLGKVGPHNQLMELDLYNETGGGLGMFMLAPDYYQQQVRLARDRGLIGIIPRVDDGFRSNRGTPNEFNVFVYNRLVHDPDADVAPMWEAFFVPYYGPRASPVAIACLKETFDLVCSLAYTLGFWTGPPGAEIRYTDQHLAQHNSALWSDDPQYKTIERLLRESGPEAIRQTVAEKRQAEQTARACIARLDAARDAFDPAQFAPLRETFVRGRDHGIVGQSWARCYFALRWYRNTRSSEAKTEVTQALAASQAFVARQQDATNPPAERVDTGRLPGFNEQMARALEAME
jgi:hypothetical protein